MHGKHAYSIYIVGHCNTENWRLKAKWEQNIKYSTLSCLNIHTQKQNVNDTEHTLEKRQHEIITVLIIYRIHAIRFNKTERTKNIFFSHFFRLITFFLSRKNKFSFCFSFSGFLVSVCEYIRLCTSTLNSKNNQNQRNSVDEIKLNENSHIFCIKFSRLYVCTVAVGMRMIKCSILSRLLRLSFLYIHFAWLCHWWWFVGTNPTTWHTVHTINEFICHLSAKTNRQPSK